MAYLTDTSLDNYNQLKETRDLLIKSFDWKSMHTSDQKSLNSRIIIIKNVEQQLNEIERRFKMPLTKSAELTLKAAKERINAED